jgi:hypothetical protein
MNPASLALDGGDQRDPVQPAAPLETQLLRAAHDSSVSFEEYMYYAAITRADEKAANERHVAAMGPKTVTSVLKNRFSKGHVETPDDAGSARGEETGLEEKGADDAGAAEPENDPLRVTEAEWKTASRALRTAGWSSVFYLVTTDILGPFSVPWAFAQMGYGPGVALYTVFGVLAA